MRTLAFRIDDGAATTLEQIAEKKGVTPSDFLRSLVSKVLVPMKENEDAKAAAIATLSPAGRKRVARAIEIKKELRALRDSHSAVGPLDDVFEVSDDTAGRIRDLERELETLKTAVEKEAAELESSGKGRGAGLSVHKVQAVPVPDEEEVDEDDDQAEDEDADEEEVDEADEGDEAPGSGADEKEARYETVKKMLAELDEVREPRSVLDDIGSVVFGDGLPVVELLNKELKGERDGEPSDPEHFDKLRRLTSRAIAIRKKVLKFKAEDTDAARKLAQARAVELAKLRPEVLALIEERKSREPKAGFWD